MAGPAFTLDGAQVERAGRAILRLDRLEIPAAEVTAVLGPSGAGKSTLLRLLAGLEIPTAGTVWDGASASAPVPGEVVLVFQRPALLRGTVEENAGLGLRLRGVRDWRPEARAWLDRLGLGGRAGQAVRTLSGGEYQRVALARALALQPRALLLDEPTANLDPDNIALIEREVCRVQRERGMTVVWVTHNPAQAARIAGSALLLMEGELVEHTPTDRFFGPEARSRTRDFLSGRLVW